MASNPSCVKCRRASLPRSRFCVTHLAEEKLGIVEGPGQPPCLVAVGRGPDALFKPGDTICTQREGQIARLVRRGYWVNAKVEDTKLVATREIYAGDEILVLYDSQDE